MKKDAVSSTALTVLQGLLYTSRKPEFSHLVSEETQAACEALLSHSHEGRKRLRQLQSRLFLASVPLAERLIMPGLTLHYSLRKKCIEEYTRAAVERGVTQVINLGAGFDTLAFRLAREFPNVSFIEVDHPATQRHKAEAFQALDSPCHLLPVDFVTQNLDQQLSAADIYAPEKSTLFISEGVLMYLAEQDVRALFSGLKRISGNQMEVIFTYLDPSEDNSNGPLLAWYLKLKKEQLHWSITRRSLGEFLSPLGYELEMVIDATGFQQRYLPNQNVTLHRGEAVAVAR